MKWLREPLLQFALGGAALFAAYAVMNPGLAENGSPPVRIGAGEVQWLRQTFASQWRRDPNPDEMNGLMETLVGEELLAREARALGLDMDDTIVRRRLAQKLEFMVEDTARIAEPSEAEVQAYFDSHRESYKGEPTISFEQVFFSTRRPSPDADARSALTLISTGGMPEPDGDPLPLERAFVDIDRSSTTRLFGGGFATAVFEQPVGAWIGPLQSAFGFHLVRVGARAPAADRPLDAVRVSVVEDWRRARNAETKRAYLTRLREKYGVVIDGAPGARQAEGAGR